MSMRMPMPDWPVFKWLLLLVPLALYGCGNSDAERAKELRTRLDEAQVRIGAQATRLARIERGLVAAGKITHHAGQRLQNATAKAAIQTRQIRTLQQQRRALMQDQQNLRQALVQYQAQAQQFNRERLAAAQNIEFLRQRVATLFAWSQRQSTDVEKARLDLASMQKKVTTTKKALAQAEISLTKANNRIEHLQQARRYLTDRLGACQVKARQSAKTPACPVS